MFKNTKIESLCVTKGSGPHDPGKQMLLAYYLYLPPVIRLPKASYISRVESPDNSAFPGQKYPEIESETMNMTKRVYQFPSFRVQ